MTCFMICGLFSSPAGCPRFENDCLPGGFDFKWNPTSMKIKQDIQLKLKKKQKKKTVILTFNTAL